MTTEGSPVGDALAHPATAGPATSLWEQPSFLVTLLTSALWLTAAVSLGATPARALAIFLIIVTVAVYAAYRRRRGWKPIPTSGWRTRGDMSPGRRLGVGLYILFLLTLVAAGAATQNKTGITSTENTGATWSKSAAATTCGDWGSAMTGEQRSELAATILAHDRLQTPMPGDAALNSVTVYVDTIGAMCRDELDPSDLILQNWEAVPPPP